jgi:hypothetical protein
VFRRPHRLATLVVLGVSLLLSQLALARHGCQPNLDGPPPAGSPNTEWRGLAQDLRPTEPCPDEMPDTGDAFASPRWSAPASVGRLHAPGPVARSSTTLHIASSDGLPAAARSPPANAARRLSRA